MNKYPLEGGANTSDLWKSIVITSLLLKKKETVHKVGIGFGELVIAVFQRPKVIVKTCCPDAGSKSMNTVSRPLMLVLRRTHLAWLC